MSKQHRMDRWPGIIESYREFLPVNEKTPVVTLLEGGTPLIPAPRLAAKTGGEIDLFLKFEGENPTGSFKDRGMTLAISKAKEEGAKAVICASTGNTSASTAAYSTRCDLKAYVLIPEGKIALGKMAQAMIHQATILQVKGNFDDALALVKQLAEKYPVTVVNSINPYRLEGQKTAAFEICDVLGSAPDYHFMPVGNAGNITAHWMGYKEYYKRGKTASLPKMIGLQAAGSAPIVHDRVIKDPHTIATAIRIGNPASWKPALKAASESRGEINLVTDDEITEAYRMIAEFEGVFCEPASAAGVAGVIKLGKRGIFKKGEVVVCTLTGHGLKDPDFSIGISKKPVTIQGGLDNLIRALEF